MTSPQMVMNGARGVCDTALYAALEGVFIAGALTIETARLAALMSAAPVMGFRAVSGKPKQLAEAPAPKEPETARNRRIVAAMVAAVSQSQPQPFEPFRGFRRGIERAWEEVHGPIPAERSDSHVDAGAVPVAVPYIEAG